MKGAFVGFIAKVEGMVQEGFSGALPQTPSRIAPPSKNPGGATGTLVHCETTRKKRRLFFISNINYIYVHILRNSWDL